jgi:hypothetical protein
MTMTTPTKPAAGVLSRDDLLEIARKHGDRGNRFIDIPLMEEVQAEVLRRAALTPSGASQPEPAGTPSSRWRESGEPDPHAGHYDGERAALTLGDLSDEELANGAFMNYDVKLSFDDLVNLKPGVYPPIVWMTAVKDRIRWLSRALETALAAPQAGASQQAAPEGWMLVPMEPTDAMANAFAYELEGACGSFFEWSRGGVEGYRAMLAAAPQASPAPAVAIEKAVLQAAEIGLANLLSYQSSANKPRIDEFGQARRALSAVRAALASLPPALGGADGL